MFCKVVFGVFGVFGDEETGSTTTASLSQFLTAATVPRQGREGRATAVGMAPQSLLGIAAMMPVCAAKNSQTEQVVVKLPP